MAKQDGLVKMSLSEVIRRNKFYRLHTRLMRFLVKVLHSDSENDRGMRLLSQGDISLLKGFEFNQEALLSHVFTPIGTVTVDRAAGTLAISFPAFVPTDSVHQPDDATHLQITLAGVEIDFDAEEYQTRLERSVNIPLTNEEIPAIELSAALTAGSDKPWLGVLALDFYQEVNGKFYDLNNSAYSAMKMIVAEKV